MKNASDTTPLYYALYLRQNLKIIQLLINKRADINTKNKNQQR